MLLTFEDMDQNGTLSRAKVVKRPGLGVDRCTMRRGRMVKRVRGGLYITMHLDAGWEVVEDDANVINGDYFLPIIDVETDTQEQVQQHVHGIRRRKRMGQR